MQTNKKSSVFAEERLAGGMGLRSAKQSNEAALRRLVMACLLWEDNAYSDGKEVSVQIAELIPTIEPNVVFNIALEARLKQKLRHTPLFIAREMVRHASHKGLVSELLPRIINRADEITEFLALYWKDGKTPIANQVLKGLAKTMNNFGEFHYGKYNRKKNVMFRDVMRLTHPVPKNDQQNEVFGKIKTDTLKTPETWEVFISQYGNKKEVWEDLLDNQLLGALAFLRNLSNLVKAGVEDSKIRGYFSVINPEWLLPINYIAAWRAEPQFQDVIEQMMLSSFDQRPKLHGKSIFVIDVSGSMQTAISEKSKLNRIDAAVGMAIVARSMCSDVDLYVTAGDDLRSGHKTMKIESKEGFDVSAQVELHRRIVGGGGIFTRQCLEWIKDQGYQDDSVERIIIFSDSQDCDTKNKVPKPFGKRNYIVDVSAHKNGVNYTGIWTAEISGWSDAFMDYILSYEEER